jgi:hypothetical protein
MRFAIAGTRGAWSLKTALRYSNRRKGLLAPSFKQISQNGGRRPRHYPSMPCLPVALVCPVTRGTDPYTAMSVVRHQSHLQECGVMTDIQGFLPFLIAAIIVAIVAAIPVATVYLGVL